MAYDESLARRVTRHFAARGAPCETKRMMGGLCYMVRGKMCVGLESHRLMARIGPEQEAAALQRPGCRPMDFTGRPMRGFVFVDTAFLQSDAALAEWLDLALAFNPSAKSSRKPGRPRKPRVEPLKPFRENLSSKKSPNHNLGALLNLGPKSSAWLAEAGITTRAQLERLGPIEACRRMGRSGRPVSVLLAYAIEAGLAGCHWQEFPGETKSFLRSAFAKMRREETGRLKAARRG